MLMAVLSSRRWQRKSRMLKTTLKLLNDVYLADVPSLPEI